MSCGCKGNGAVAPAQAAPVAATSAELAGKAQINYNLVAQVQLHPCEDCAKDGAKPFAISFSASTGMHDSEYTKRFKVVSAGIQAAAEAAKAAHEAH